MKRLLLSVLLIMIGSNALANRLKVGQIPASRVSELESRRHALRLWGISFGPYATRDLDSDAMVYALAITRHREVTEQGEIRMRFGGGIAEDGSAHTVSATMGAAYLPMLGDITPMLGAEFGFGHDGGKNVKGAEGFVGAALAGVRFFRTANSHMEIAARYESMIRRQDGRRPATFGAQLGVLF